MKNQFAGITGIYPAKLLFIALFCFTSLFTFEAKAATPVLVDAGNGTIVDTANNLTWLQNANCFSPQTWDTAIASSNALASGQCGLMDGSVAGDWHLPTIDELRIFTDSGLRYDTLNAAGFVGVQPSHYWSSTTSATIRTTRGAWPSTVGTSTAAVRAMVCMSGAFVADSFGALIL